MPKMNEDFQIGDAVIFNAPAGEAPAVVVAKTEWASTFTPSVSWRISVYGDVIEVWPGQISKIQ